MEKYDKAFIKWGLIVSGILLIWAQFVNLSFKEPPAICHGAVSPLDYVDYVPGVPSQVVPEYSDYGSGSE